MTAEDLRRLAERGEAAAQYRLAMWYEGGSNYRQAYLWYRRAADQGFAQAQYSLGRMYEFGQGVPWNDAQALFWYRKAAAQGHGTARWSAESLESRKKPRGSSKGRQDGLPKNTKNNHSKNKENP